MSDTILPQPPDASPSPDNDKRESDAIKLAKDIADIGRANFDAYITHCRTESELWRRQFAETTRTIWIVVSLASLVIGGVVASGLYATYNSATEFRNELKDLSRIEFEKFRGEIPLTARQEVQKYLSEPKIQELMESVAKNEASGKLGGAIQDAARSEAQVLLQPTKKLLNAQRLSILLTEVGSKKVYEESKAILANGTYPKEAELMLKSAIDALERDTGRLELKAERQLGSLTDLPADPKAQFVVATNDKDPNRRTLALLKIQLQGQTTNPQFSKQQLTTLLYAYVEAIERAENIGLLPPLFLRMRDVIFALAPKAPYPPTWLGYRQIRDWVEHTMRNFSEP